jgi:hypothetical protein
VTAVVVLLRLGHVDQRAASHQAHPPTASVERVAPGRWMPARAVLLPYGHVRQAGCVTKHQVMEHQVMEHQGMEHQGMEHQGRMRHGATGRA